MKTKIFCTLGPASLRPEVIRGLDDCGVDLFRINLSHTPLDRVASTIRLVREQSSTPICLDTEGAQVRCGLMEPDVVVKRRQRVVLTASDVVGSPGVIGLRPAPAVEGLRRNTTLSVDFDGVVLRVTRVTESGAHAVVVEGGRIRSNKAVTVEPPPRLPPFSDRDLGAIKLGSRLGIRYFALSFASSAEDVGRLRAAVPAKAIIISKIESRVGVQNVDGITSASDAVLIDRGDLSREVPIEQVPMCQKHIIRRANAWNKPVYVATNLLESMVGSRTPTLAEANDIINTLIDGAHGLVLAAETAIGDYPVQSVEMVLRLVRAFENSISHTAFDQPLRRPRRRVTSRS